VCEVDRLAVDLGHELRQLVEAALVRAPVIASAPVIGQITQEALRDAVIPAHAGKLVRPAARPEPPLQLLHVTLGDLDVKRADIALTDHEIHNPTNCGLDVSAISSQ